MCRRCINTNALGILGKKCKCECDSKNLVRKAGPTITPYTLKENVENKIGTPVMSCMQCRHQVDLST
jgi:hypothetical protein